MKNNFVHIARIKEGRRHSYLYLKKTGSETYQWFHGDEPTEVKGITPEEACRLAVRHWRIHSFRFVRCGFRFTLPERDEHGSNALFHQMAASYDAMNGIYYDEELGHSCIVKEASSEAKTLWLMSKQKQS
jgi:hypothetical protein